MNDRDTFLRQILAAPQDDTVRLVYADWLDENGGSDLDAATAEFIRLGCVRPGADSMPQAAYRWLLTREGERTAPRRGSTRGEPLPTCANWQRLVPGLVRLHTRTHLPDPEGPHTAMRDGRRVRAVIRLALPPRPSDGRVRRAAIRDTPVNLYFRRGFLEGCRVHHRGARALVGPAVLADQPLAALLAYDRPAAPEAA